MTHIYIIYKLYIYKYIISYNHIYIYTNVCRLIKQSLSVSCSHPPDLFLQKTPWWSAGAVSKPAWITSDEILHRFSFRCCFSWNLMSLMGKTCFYGSYGFMDFCVKRKQSTNPRSCSHVWGSYHTGGVPAESDWHSSHNLHAMAIVFHVRVRWKIHQVCNMDTYTMIPSFTVQMAAKGASTTQWKNQRDRNRFLESPGDRWR